MNDEVEGFISYGNRCNRVTSRSTFMHKNEIAEVRLFNFRIRYFFHGQTVTEIRLRWVRRSLAEKLSN